MSFATVRDRLQPQFAAIAGITTSFRTIPRVLQHVELPAVVIFPGRADYDLNTFGEQIALEQRLYEAVLFVGELGEGAEGAVEEACEVFIPLVKARFLGRPGLALSGNDGLIYDLEFLGDGAPVARPYPRNGERLYAAIPFYFRVKELTQITYHD